MGFVYSNGLPFPLLVLIPLILQFLLCMSLMSPLPVSLLGTTVLVLTVLEVPLVEDGGWVWREDKPTD